MTNTKNCDVCAHIQESIFKNCADSNVAFLTNSRENIEYKKGDIILKEGTPFKGIYCISEGLAKIVKLKGAKNKNFFLWFALPGEAIGLRGYIHNENHTYSAVAITPCKVCFIPESEFKTLIEKEPLVSAEIMKALCKRIHFVERRINDTFLKDTPTRLAELLLLIANEIQPNKENAIYYSMDELADIIGSTTNYVNKLIIRLKNTGVISRNGKNLCINSMEKLKVLAYPESNLSF